MATTLVGANQGNHSGPVGGFSGMVKAPDGGQHRRYVEASADFRGSQMGPCHGALNAQLTAGQALPQLFSLCCSRAHDRLLASAWPPSVERLSLEQPSTTHGVPLNRQTTAIGRKIPPTKSLVDPSKPVSLGLVEPRDLQEIHHAEGDRD
jgi:hypothetical protein